MALEFLRRAIFKETAGLKAPKSKMLARTFYLVLSPSMGHLQDWFHKWFPDSDEAIRSVHPWYIADKSVDADKLEDLFKSKFIEAFSVDVTNKLMSDGYQISSTASQVILIGDLTEDGFGNKLESVLSCFKKIVAEFGNHESPVYFTGLFLCRNLEQDAEGQFKEKSCKDIGNKLKAIREKLDRVFFIDISNAAGIVVSKEKDMHFLIGQLLYILSKKPLEFTETSSFAAFGEWLRRVSPRDNHCSGFSGISILNPIDQLLETLLIAKGGEVMNSAFFGGVDDAKVEFYAKSLINNTHLNSLDVFSKMLKENGTAPLIDPFKDIEAVKSSWHVDWAEEFAAYIDSLDAHLASDASENKKTMDSLGQLLMDKFRYELLEHLNAAISNETGGLLVAEKFLAKLKEKIEGMIPQKVTDQPYPDISNLILKLVEMCKNGPRKKSLILKGAVFFLATLAGIAGSRGLFDWPTMVFPLVIILAVAAVIVYWNASKNQMERLVSRIWQNLSNKWDVLMDREFTETFADLLPKYVLIIDGLAKRVEESQKRMREVIAFFTNQYLAESPAHSAFWRYAVNNREDFMKYLPKIQTNIQDNASAYLKEERPLELWNRTAPPNSDQLNEWEWTLGENIGLRLLPVARNIIDLSVSQLLKDSPAQTEVFLQLLKGAAQPFLSVKPGSLKCIPQSTVEMPDEGGEDLYKKIESALSGSFSRIERKDSMSPYRISLFSFAENVSIDSLKAGG